MIRSKIFALLFFFHVSGLNSSKADDQNPLPPPPGFSEGGDNINPFINPQDDIDGFGSDSEFETDLDDFDDSQASTAAQTPATSASQSNSAPTAPSVTPTNRPAVSLGGESAGGVIASKAPAALTIDDETGEGSKEIVTDFNFPNADILDIAKALGRLTGKNFIYEKDTKGTISIISNSPITVGDAWRAFLTALDINNYTLIPSGKYIRIARQRDARDKQIKTYTGDFIPNSDALITRVFQLKYITADEVTRVFRNFIPANSRIVPHDQTNTVIVTDSGSNIAKLGRILEILDVEGFDVGIEVITVRYASATELSKLMDALLPGTRGGLNAGGAPRFGNQQFAARRTKEGGVIQAVISDERTNSLIVHANGKGFEQVQALVRKLDQKVPVASGGGKVHVIYLQYADATEISTTITNLIGSSGSSPAGAKGANPVSQSLFEGSIKVSPDKATNSLVVTASPADFVVLQRVVRRLDIQRDQVYVEAVIMELTIQNTFNFSINAVMPSAGLGLLPKGEDLLKFIQDPIASKGFLLGFKQGKTVEVPVGGKTVKVSSVQGLIKAIQANTQTNILASPQILTLDNQKATFETGENIPVPTTTIGQGGVQNVSLTKEKVAITIEITPQINKLSNFVKLQIKTNLSDFSNRELPTALQSQAVATVERRADTTIIVADSDTAVLGGMVRDTNKATVSKVPLLGDIPILGWLFKSKETEVQKTNLLIFITPKVVRQYTPVREILDKKLKERDDFLEANAGGTDPFRRQRDAMIRSLPDMQDIMNKNEKSQFTLDDETESAVEPLTIPARPGSTSQLEQNPQLGAAALPESLLPPPPVDFEGQSVAPPVEGAQTQ